MRSPATVLPTLAALGLLGLLLRAEQAEAQACCTATGSGEFGLVGPCHDAALALQLSHQQVVGSYGDSGSFRALGDAIISDTTLSLGAGVRLFGRRLELGVIAPFRLQVRSIGDELAGSFRPGDVFLGSRLTTMRDTTTGIEAGNTASYRPFIDVIAGLRLPTGRAPEDSEDPLGADVSGSGAFESNLGLKVTKFLTLEHSISLSFIWAHRFAREVPSPGGSVEFALGEQLITRASWLYLPSLRWSAGLFVSAGFTLASSEGGQEVASSASHRIGFGGFATWVFDFPNWEVTASLTVDPFLPGAGRNLPYVGPTLALFLKRGFL